MRKGYIYKMTSPSGKVYIGQTISIDVRKSKYRKLNCKGQHKIYNSLLKYGYDNHNFEIIEEIDYDKDLLNDLEVYYIGLYKSNLIGLNIQAGGNSKTHTQETKDLISSKGKGRKRSIEVCDNMRSYFRENSTQNKIVLDILTGIYYISCADAERTLGYKNGELRRRLNNQRKNNTSLRYV